MSPSKIIFEEHDLASFRFVHIQFASQLWLLGNTGYVDDALSRGCITQPYQYIMLTLICQGEH